MSACVKKLQRLLKTYGYYHGKIDGIEGPMTRRAFADMVAQGKVELKQLEEATKAAPEYPKGGQDWPHQREMLSYYGRPGTGLTTASFPIQMKLAWDTKKTVRRFTCHRLCKDAFEWIFEEALKIYGEKDFRRLNLDMYGGCYNKRRIRGGRSWSTHAFGAAMDIWPNRNGMWVRAPKAPLSRPEYKEWWDIVEKAGAISLGRAIGRDWMHFQFAKLG